jgi:hypothetical protein
MGLSDREKFRNLTTPRCLYGAPNGAFPKPATENSEEPLVKVYISRPEGLTDQRSAIRRFRWNERQQHPLQPADSSVATPESPRSTPNPQTTTNMLSLIPKMGNRTVGCAKRPLFPAESGNKLISYRNKRYYGETPVGPTGESGAGWEE